MSEPIDKTKVVMMPRGEYHSTCTAWMSLLPGFEVSVRKGKLACKKKRIRIRISSVQSNSPLLPPNPNVKFNSHLIKRPIHLQRRILLLRFSLPRPQTHPSYIIFQNQILQHWQELALVLSELEDPGVDVGGHGLWGEGGAAEWVNFFHGGGDEVENPCEVAKGELVFWVRRTGC